MKNVEKNEVKTGAECHMQPDNYFESVLLSAVIVKLIMKYIWTILSCDN